MADSTVSDISKLKVVELRKELKLRGLPYAGDKAELIARLQSAVAQDDHGDITLDSDDNVEFDSDGVLEDEDDKSQNDILDESGVDNIVDTHNEDLVLSEKPIVTEPVTETKPQRTLKRKINAPGSENSEEQSTKKDVGSKKIVLNRASSVTITASTSEEKEETKIDDKTQSDKIKITADIDPQTRLEMRAKRFGLPVKVSDAERKEARKQRFNQNTGTSIVSSTLGTGTLSENIEKLKKRAERFGQSVSKIMTDIENKEKLEKRKEKFTSAK